MDDESMRTVYVTIQPSDLANGESFREHSQRIGMERALSTPDLGLDEIPWLGMSSATLDFSCGDERMNQSHGNLLWDEQETAKIRKNCLSKKNRGKSIPNKSPKAATSKTREIKVKFFKLLNKFAGGATIDCEEIMQIMKEEPSVVKAKYLLPCFSEPVTALHTLSAFNAPLECIKKCYKENPKALRDSTSSVGTPCHLACKRNVALRVVRYFAAQDPDSLLVVDHAKRTPLHIAVMEGADSELVALLTEACPEAAEVADINNCTPLALAVSVDKPDLDVIDDLISSHPSAIADGTLHRAIKNKGLPTSILKMLVLTWPKALKSVDGDGNSPLHNAVLHNRAYKDIKVMAKKYSKGLHKENAKGETAFQVAKRLGLSDEIVDVLRPDDGDLV